MKHLWMALTLLSATVVAQNALAQDAVAQTGLAATARPDGASPAYVPSYSKINCAGFLSRKAISRSATVIGSKESPHEGQFYGHSTLFLQGPGLEAGTRYTLLRRVSDPNLEEPSEEQRKRLQSLGALYSEIGYVTVKSVDKGTAIANFDFACDTAIIGDMVVPYVEKPSLTPRTWDMPIAPFRLPKKTPKGTLLGTRDFQELLGTGVVAYTDFGTKKGAKTGDYVLITRGYKPENFNRIDRLSSLIPEGADPAGQSAPKVRTDAAKNFPDRVLGEALVLYTTSESSTLLITRALSEMQLGDVVQSESEEVAEATAVPETGSTTCVPPTLLERLRRPWRRGCKK